MGHVEILETLLAASDDEWNQWAMVEEYPRLQAMNAIGMVNAIIEKSSPRDIGQLTIVDVGCGGNGRDACPPFFCIIAGMFGATAHGVDLFEYEGDGAGYYTHHESSILGAIGDDGVLHLRTLTGLQTCDVVVSNGLTGRSPSPTLQGILEHFGNPLSIADVSSAIRRGAKEILRPGGFLYENGALIDAGDL